MRAKKNKRKNQLSFYIEFFTLTLQMAVIITAGVFFGDFLDSSFNLKTPVYTIICSLLSVFSALYYVFKKVIDKKDENK